MLVWGQRECTQVPGIKHPDNSFKPIFIKELAKLWRALATVGADFGAENTVLIDDSVYKTVLNPPHTALHPNEWLPWDGDDDGLSELRDLLEAVSTGPSVPEFLEGCDSGLVCHEERLRGCIEEIPGLWEYKQMREQGCTDEPTNKTGS
eukprot:TRINITY_DN26846_c0_g1_i2.p1 TRINITY_DN26846_c0_g1~~TRINITY_DN26846_c0_g1_i2.p1  ORF type:complete len:149 (-),score=21.01 TRINITY_DN26846_c0_g1_i2:301-747(-)